MKSLGYKPQDSVGAEEKIEPEEDSNTEVNNKKGMIYIISMI